MQDSSARPMPLQHEQLPARPLFLRNAENILELSAISLSKITVKAAKMANRGDAGPVEAKSCFVSYKWLPLA